MTLAADPPASAAVAAQLPDTRSDAPEPDRPRRGMAGQPSLARAHGVLRWLGAVAGAVAVFTLFLVLKGADPLDVYRSMWESASADGFGETFLRATPFLLAGLAVAVPARAGLFNIGGEGQLLMGAVGAMAVARQLGDAPSTPMNLTVMCLGGALAGGLWAAIPAILRVALKTNEAITSLLLNYTAGLILTWLVFEPWKDPQSLGQAYSEPLGDHQVLPVVWGNRVHLGIFIAALAAIGVWLLLRATRWGFRLRVLGGNPEAARRAGFAVGGLTLGAMVLGGALAGLGGAIELAGVESRLRPDLMVGFGFVGFLASWLVRHDPLKLIGSSFLLAAIAVGGTGLKISSGLSGAAVNVLMALTLLAVLGWGQKKEASA
jgi:general nucleoside transport system permease protein